MDFIPRPEETKKFGTVKWLKWNLARHLNVCIVVALGPCYLFLWAKRVRDTERGMNDGTYVPGVIRNKYTICRPGDFLDVNTPERYKN